MRISYAFIGFLYLNSQICLIEGQGFDCDGGWILHKNICYLFVGVKSSWLEAIDYCKLFNANLLEIDSPDENAFILNASLHVLHHGLSFHQKIAESYWIALNDIEVEGQYVWLSDHQPMTFSSWAPGEPLTGPGLNSDCVELAAHFRFMWNDAPCDSKIHFICKKEADIAGVIIG